jgi:monoamine oxidase
MIGLSAAAAGAAVLSPVLDWSAYAKEEQLKRPIGIVGGGVAGLTAAYRLHQAGKTPILFEASNRWGGRMFTRYNFYKGMFCELGGELVDSNHCDLKNLLDELGLNRQPLENEGEDLYFFKGKFRKEKDMLDRNTQSGAYVPIAEQIRKDHNRLRDKYNNWTAYARDLDNNTSLKKYLEQFRGKTIRGKTIDGWVIDVLELAYVNENGLEAEDHLRAYGDAPSLWLHRIATRSDCPRAIWQRSQWSHGSGAQGCRCPSTILPLKMRHVGRGSHG